MNDYTQNGQGLLGDVQPGRRVRDAFGRLTQGNNGPDMSQASELVPDSPGPAALGRTPALGQLRRDREMPVIRDQVPSLLD